MGCGTILYKYFRNIKIHNLNFDLLFGSLVLINGNTSDVTRFSSPTWSYLQCLLTHSKLKVKKKETVLNEFVEMLNFVPQFFLCCNFMNSGFSLQVWCCSPLRINQFSFLTLLLFKQINLVIWINPHLIHSLCVCARLCDPSALCLL